MDHSTDKKEKKKEKEKGQEKGLRTDLLCATAPVLYHSLLMRIRAVARHSTGTQLESALRFLPLLSAPARQRAALLLRRAWRFPP